MAKFVYNNARNASIGHTSFKLNCYYHFCISYKKDVNLHFKSKSTDKLASELQKLMMVYNKNLYHAQKIQKQAQNKGLKLKRYVPG